MDRFLDAYGIDPDSTFITNIGRVYRVGNPDPTPDDIELWESLLREELNAAKPHWIASIGRISTRYFIGDVDMDATHGIPFLVVLPWLDNGRGGRVVIVPVVHPAAGFHNTEAQAVTAYDFAQLDAVINGRLTPRTVDTADAFPDPDYRDLDDSNSSLDFISAQFEQATVWVPQPAPLAIDTEGLPGKPWGLSFSFEAGTGYVIRKVHQRATKRFASLLSALAARVHVILHNSLHDLRVLRELGITLPGGGYTDTMVLAYHLCIEPQGLKPLAFRHAGMLMESYDEQVQDARDRIALEYYREMEAKCFTLSDCEAIEGQDVTIRAVKLRLVRSEFPLIEPYTILERDKGTGQLKERTKKPQQIPQRVRAAMRDLENGKTDAAGLRKRWDGTDDLVVDLVESVMGPMREADLDDVPLARAVRYAARDADATIRIHPVLAERHRAMGLDRIGRIDHAIIPMVDRMQAVGMPVDVPYLKQLSADLARRAVEVQQRIKAEFGVWINPNSGEQVADLLFRPVEDGGYGLEANKKTKGRVDKATGEMVGRRGSTQDKVLEGLRGAHPIVPLIMDYRGLIKAKTSFADVAVRKATWDGDAWVVHCNFRITRVSSGRLSATGPNLMAVVGGKLGKEIRDGYIAGEGYQFAEWDLNQIEMRVMASEANDGFLIDMFMRDEDVHTGTADKMFGLGLPRPYSKSQIGKDKRDPAKRTGFGVITGIQPPGLVDQMRLQGIIIGEEEAAKWINDWLAACPGVPEYMFACHREAMAYGYVRDWAGRIRYLPGIHSPFRHIQAEAGRQSHSHKIQAGAQSIMKVAMSTIWREVIPYWKEAGKYIEPVLQIHDALMLRLRGFNAAEMAELDAQIRAALFSAAPDGFMVPLDAGNGAADTWGRLDH